jgi:glucosyl-dolichyl phosphate glucuronosyltransferase
MQSREISQSFCVVIPTFNRPKDLLIAVDSICRSSILPSRIVIVDDGDVEATNENLKDYLISYSRINFILVPAKSSGLAMARNIGLSHIGNSDIVVFLDDDIVLDKDYFRNLLTTFSVNKKIVGCQGFISNVFIKEKSKKLFLCSLGIICPLVLSSFFTPYVTRLIIPKYPAFIPPINKIRKCEFLSGCNMAYRSFIFKKFSFDENLISASIGEDLDFSYRLIKADYKLAINFDAKIIHRISKEARNPDNARLLMTLGYQFYYISKFNSNKIYALQLYKCYALILLSIYFIFSLQKLSFDPVRQVFVAYKCVKRFEVDISKGNLSNLNLKIKKLL